MASVNQVPLQSSVRNPRALLKINDIVVSKIENWQYIENNYYQPDSFRVTLPLYNLHPKINIEYWLSQPAILVEILAGFPKDPVNYTASDLDSLIIGGIDQLDVNIFSENGGCVVFSGRDLSSKLIDNKTTEIYQNYTSSQIATILAKDAGLTPVVTETKTLAGYYYSQDYVQGSHEVSKWDLLTYLAQQEGFQVFVRGKSLYFQPRPLTSANPYLIQAQTSESAQLALLNGSRLKLTRNLQYARDVIVKVRSWNAGSGRVTAEARATPNKRTALAAAAQPIGEAQTYDYFIPGLNKEQALKRAQQLLTDISQHERVLEYAVPADNLLRKDSVIQLKGVSASADQVYYPDTITRTMGQGYLMDVRAKNHSPQSVVLI